LYRLGVQPGFLLVHFFCQGWLQHLSKIFDLQRSHCLLLHSSHHLPSQTPCPSSGVLCPPHRTQGDCRLWQVTALLARTPHVVTQSKELISWFLPVMSRPTYIHLCIYAHLNVTRSI
jgi:hypothetical protein